MEGVDTKLLEKIMIIFEKRWKMQHWKFEPVFEHVTDNVYRTSEYVLTIHTIGIRLGTQI